MKKITKIFSLTIAAIMAASISASAMTFNEPMSFEFPINSFVNNAGRSRSGYSYYPGYSNLPEGKYYDNGYTPAATDETPNPEKVVDSFDGSTKYLHVKGNTESSNSTLIYKTMEEWTTGNDTQNYVGSFGKSRMEFIIRIQEHTGLMSNGNLAVDVSGTSLLMAQTATKSDGSNTNIGIKGYYLGTDGTQNPTAANVTSVYIQPSGVNNSDGYIGQLKLGEWYNVTIDVDVQNSKVEYTVKQYTDDKSGEFLNAGTTKTYDIPALKCTRGGFFRAPAHIFTFDLARMKQTRDGVYVGNPTIDDTTANVTATVKVGNNAPANDYKHNYTYIAPWGGEAWCDSVDSTLWSYDGDTSKTRCISKTNAPSIICAQYNADGRLIDVKRQTLTAEEFPTLTWGRDGSETATKSASDAGFALKDLTVEFAKAAGYSYSKVFVWNNTNDIVPYAASVSTQTAVDETPEGAN